MEQIVDGLDVFVHGSDTAVGTVRAARAKSGMFRIYVENAGEFEVPLSAVKDVWREDSGGKVILDSARLDPALRHALGHAHDAEDPLVADRPMQGEDEDEDEG